MSWIARSLVNSLRGEEDDDSRQSKYTEENSNRSSLDRENEQQEGEHEDEDPTQGVEEDLSELTKTLTRQFWDVASFLAPPPIAGDPPPADPGQRSDPAADGDGEPAGSPRLAGIRSDFAEIAGRFRSGISMLSSSKAVAEISKIGSTFVVGRVAINSV